MSPPSSCKVTLKALVYMPKNFAVLSPEGAQSYIRFRAEFASIPDHVSLQELASLVTANFSTLTWFLLREYSSHY